MRIGITMGDPAGVGPEILLNSYRMNQLTGDLVVIGDYDILDFCNTHLGYGVPLQKIGILDRTVADHLNVIDQGMIRREDLRIGEITHLAGRASLRYVETATRLALEGRIAAIATLPLNKSAVQLSAPGFTGHTEFIAGLCQQNDYTMMLVSDRLLVTHVTTHVSLREAIAQIGKARIFNVIRLTNDALCRFYPTPRIAVAGLNPHAGEGGAFGAEEAAEIQPAVQRAKEWGINVTGPVAPDTVFWQALNGKYDAVVCMYHDQGHIPLKLLDFEGGINVTLGLKVIRTSVDHGTAYDIAYQGVASPKSFILAVQFARKLAEAG